MAEGTTSTTEVSLALGTLGGHFKQQNQQQKRPTSNDVALNGPREGHLFPV